jgi:hypothetical protein
VKLRTVVVAAALAVAAVVAWRLLDRGPAPTEEERIRALFEAAARAAGERSAADVVAPLSERFRGEGLDRGGVKQLVALQLLRGEWVSVALGGVQVAVDGERARANVDAVLVRAAGKGRGLAELLPGDAAAHRFECTLEREDGAWRVVAASWRPIRLDEALEGPPRPDDVR